MTRGNLVCVLGEFVPRLEIGTRVSAHGGKTLINASDLLILGRESRLYIGPLLRRSQYSERLISVLVRTGRTSANLACSIPRLQSRRLICRNLAYAVLVLNVVSLTLTVDEVLCAPDGLLLIARARD